MRTIRMSAVLLGLVFAGTMFASRARADLNDQMTKLTFDKPVEVPGRVLLPGTYEFKILQSPSDLNIVQIFNADGTHLITTLMTNSDYRLEPTGKTVIKFKERVAHAPEAIKEWFYPGETIGHEFIYPQFPVNTAGSKPGETKTGASGK